MSFPNDDAETMSSAEFAKLESHRALELLAEYSGKLSQLSREKARQKRRRAIAFLTSFLAALIITTAGLLLTGEAFFSQMPVPDEARPAIMIISLLGAGATMLLAFFVSRTSEAFYANHLAAIVERLVKTLSQYNEHSASSLMGQFEFDLRLAEADAALRVYRDVFNVAPDYPEGTAGSVIRSVRRFF